MKTASSKCFEFFYCVSSNFVNKHDFKTYFRRPFASFQDVFGTFCITLSYVTLNE